LNTNKKETMYYLIIGGVVLGVSYLYYKYNRAHINMVEHLEKDKERIRSILKSLEEL
jgi:hypothetical protein